MFLNLEVGLTNCYCYQGRFKYQPGQVRAFGMIAGGSGITPMFQVCIVINFGCIFVHFKVWYYYFHKFLILITYVASFLPMIQVARAILENPKDKTKVHLIYANVTYEDILLKVIFVTLYGSSCLLIYYLKYLSF